MGKRFCRLEHRHRPGKGGMVAVQAEACKLQKYADIGKKASRNRVYSANQEGEYFHVDGQVGYPFVGEFILDCLNGTEQHETAEKMLARTNHWISTRNMHSH
ncbi:hypothetical protein [Paenibacillus thalictri]|uniref:Gfo/Idh/MocA-like oxidoreductase C-terminal domain-containing protein n=1 Tax=Paenibacillus thalictri TaxID=2527873 RepID=A0A4Q9DE38_9BACL|nr:hypothetical protein [Paenibacillus thalictri]TBL69711.1 hypothetical protein EYB31_35640 [Paenibacillus thalictri]